VWVVGALIGVFGYGMQTGKPIPVGDTLVGIILWPVTLMIRVTITPFKWVHALGRRLHRAK